MKLIDINKSEWLNYVGLLTDNQRNELIGQLYTTDSYFNPIQDNNNNWIISIQEMEYCDNINFLWVKNLDLIIYVPKINN